MPSALVVPLPVRPDTSVPATDPLVVALAGVAHAPPAGGLPPLVGTTNDRSDTGSPALAGTLSSQSKRNCRQHAMFSALVHEARKHLRSNVELTR